MSSISPIALPGDDAMLDVAALAPILGRSVATVAADASRRPHTLPPPVRVPGTRARLWRRSTVIAWLAAHERPAPPPAPVVAQSPLQARGRPTKRLARARRCAQEADHAR